MLTHPQFNPIAFQIGSFGVHWYGLMYLIGFIGFLWLGRLRIRQGLYPGWKAEELDDLLFYGVLGVILGGRIGYVFFYKPDYYLAHLPEFFKVWQGGMAIQGGLLFGAIAGILYTKHYHIDTWAFGDLLAPAIILGQSIGRMANLMNGDAFGHPTGGDFGIVYPDTTLAYHTYGNQPLWPAEVWEGQIDVLVFVALLLYSCFPHKKGQVFCLYVMLYAVERFFLEFLRGDYVNLTLGLKSAQMTSIIAFAIALIAFILIQWKGSVDEKVSG